MGIASIHKPVAVASDIQATPVITDPMEIVRQMLQSMQASLNFAVAMLAEYEKAHRRAG